jgi:hypothetical protein
MEQHRVRDAFYHLAHEEHIPATLLIPLGDLAYDYGTEAELQQRFFVPYVARACVHIGRWVERSQVWIPLPGKANMPSLQSHACHPMLMLSLPLPRVWLRYTRVMYHTPTWPVFGNHDFLTSRTVDGTGPYHSAFTTPLAGESGGEPSNATTYYRQDWACEGHSVAPPRSRAVLGVGVCH